MGMIPQNKGISLIALGAALIICCLYREWDVVKLIVFGFFTLMNPDDTPPVK